ncbi:hypothetical protein [Escherichia coli]
MSAIRLRRAFSPIKHGGVKGGSDSTGGPQ